ncbi:putative two-component sensor histidine kinase domain protein, partial [Vibrio parahaemolyticus V-223/04]
PLSFAPSKAYIKI